MAIKIFFYLCLFVITAITSWTEPKHNFIKPDSNLVLQGGSIVNVRKKKIETRDLYMCQGIIVDEQTGKKCAKKILNVSGKWLIPGLNDMHIHARGQLWGNDKWTGLKAREVAKIMAKAGVVRFLDAMQDENIIFKARDEQRLNPDAREADIFCAGGAFTPTNGHGFEYAREEIGMTAMHVVDTKMQAISEVNVIAKKNPDVIKIMYDHRGKDTSNNTITIKDGEQGVLGKSMGKSVMQSIVKRSKELGLKPYVHIGVWSDAQDAINAGATIINHLGEGAIPSNLLSLIRKKRIYWIPTLVVYQDFINIQKNQNLLDDELLKIVAPLELINSYKFSRPFMDDYCGFDEAFFTTQYQKRHTKSDPINIKKLFQAGAIIVVGSDTPERGSFIGWSTHREMALLVAYGLTPWDALRAATTNAGELMGLDYGIEPGAEGNVIVLNSSPIDDIWNTTKIRHVIHRGEVIHSYSR